MKIKSKKIIKMMIALLLIIVCSNSEVQAKSSYIKIKKKCFVEATSYPYENGDRYRYAQGICCVGNKIFVAIRNDSGECKLRKYKLKSNGKCEFISQSGSLKLGHANSMTYCKKLGGIVVSTCENNNTTINVVNVKDYSTKSIDVGMENYAVGYSEKLGLVIAKRKNGYRIVYRYSIDKNGNVERIDNSKIMIDKRAGFEPQGMCVYNDTIIFNQDKIDKKKTTADLNKYYEKNRFLIYKIEIEKDEKSNIADKKRYSVKLDRELEDMCYNSKKKCFYICGNLNHGTRKMYIYKLKKSKLVSQ